jgi:hypothetical protein
MSEYFLKLSPGSQVGSSNIHKLSQLLYLLVLLYNLLVWVVDYNTKQICKSFWFLSSIKESQKELKQSLFYNFIINQRVLTRTNEVYFNHRHIVD